jgi:hypothetical protein
MHTDNFSLSPDADDTLEQYKQIWDEAIVRRVEVDLGGWLEQLTGASGWNLQHELEEDLYMGFFLSCPGHEAEVTLYHNGFARVEFEGGVLFEGNLRSDTSPCAHLSYYHAASGAPVQLH